MEGIREICRSYYEIASEDEKDKVEEFFRKVDINGDGKISHMEYKKCVSYAEDDVFKLLDTNGDETLDFNDVLCLYYMEKKVNITRCSVCSDLLLGPYFSCLLCFDKSPNIYNICCSCYRRQNFSGHHHSSDNLIDRHSLLVALRDHAAAAEKTRAKKDMEELCQISKAHYRAGSPEIQYLAYEFFKSMDSDGDGRVDLTEFLTFMTHHGYSHMRNHYFFDELDHDGNGTLDFSEVMTLYYIIKSGRPFCSCCAKFIPGIFFTCVECFKKPGTSFDLCLDCYRSVKCEHNHNGRAQFLDNHTLLQATRDSTVAQPYYSNEAWTSTTSPNSIVPLQHGHLYAHNPAPTYNVPYNNNAIVPASNWSKWNAALHAFELALSIGSISSTLCTIL